jgi:hypothetical protein
MPIRIITSFGHLMRLARAEGEARLSGDPQHLAEAAAAHEAYRRLCLEADEMHIHARIW